MAPLDRSTVAASIFAVIIGILIGLALGRSELDENNNVLVGTCQR
jgi:hypothetical protein